MLDKLIELLDESKDIFFEERLALSEKGNKPVIVKESERRSLNEKSIKKTSEELGKAVQESLRAYEQEQIQTVAEQVKLI